MTQRQRLRVRALSALLVKASHPTPATDFKLFQSLMTAASFFYADHLSDAIKLYILLGTLGIGMAAVCA